MKRGFWKNFDTFTAMCRVFHIYVKEMKPGTDPWPVAMALCDGYITHAIDLMLVFVQRGVLKQDAHKFGLQGTFTYTGERFGLPAVDQEAVNSFIA